MKFSNTKPHQSHPVHSPQTWGFGGLLLLTIAFATPAALAFKAPKLPNRGAPGTAKAGASRDLCRLLEQPLTAIVPVEKTSGIVGGLTVAAQPTLWFLNPYRLGMVKKTDCGKLEFVFQDDQEKVIYRESYAPGVGIFGIKLPEKVQLERDRTYQWSLIARIPNQPVTSVTGWVQRIEGSPSLTQTLKQAKTPAAQSAAYSSAGIWHDSLEPLCAVTDVKTGAVTESCGALIGILLQGEILFPTDE
jgi:Domain of Unknown Function (DUF928)